MVVDATIIRCVLLPASMTLLGDANWYLEPSMPVVRRRQRMVGWLLVGANVGVIAAGSLVGPWLLLDVIFHHLSWRSGAVRNPSGEGGGLATRRDTVDVVAYASYPRRVGAWFIDVLLIMSVFIGIAVALRYAFLPSIERSESGQGPEILLIPFMPLYGALCHRYWHGQTLGKRAFGIAVQDVDGDPVSLGQALGRAYLRAALFVCLYVPWILDSLWPLWQSDNRSLHDLAASTIVVRHTSETPPPRLFEVDGG